MEAQEQPNARRPEKRPARKMADTWTFIHDDVQNPEDFHDLVNKNLATYGIVKA